MDLLVLIEEDNFVKYWGGSTFEQCCGWPCSWDLNPLLLGTQMKATWKGTDKALGNLQMMIERLILSLH